MPTDDEFLPITYRDFYDVPRIFVVVRDGVTFLFDSKFDEASDDYPDHYRVYRMKDGFSPPSGSWELLADQAARSCGTVPVKAVEFDPTLRASIRSSVLDPFVGPDSTGD